MKPWPSVLACTAGTACLTLLMSPQRTAADEPARTYADDHSRRSGIDDFDFLIGRWNVHHRRLNKRLAHDDHWTEFGGTLFSQKILGGAGILDENLIEQPGTPYHAVAIRAFDEKRGQWSIWWLDGRAPGAALEPAVRGGFKDGVGIFYAKDTLNGQPILVRYLWSDISRKSCRWEQAFSADGGSTWEINWTMNFTRAD